jgi:hypothetical protein
MSMRSSRRFVWVSTWATGLVALAAYGQVSPPPPPPPLPAGGHVHVHQPGAVHRAAHHVGFVLKDQLIGYPELFDVPPAGYSVYNVMTAQTAKGDLHTFMLYRSDFVAGTNELSPGGARRLSNLASRLPSWRGPVVVEWTPEAPGLAESRRDSVTALLTAANLPAGGGRVVVGPSPYSGLLGTNAASNYDMLIFRDIQAQRVYSVSPTTTATFGGGTR